MSLRHEDTKDSKDTKDWVKGDPESGTRLVEYGDFECPFCGGAYWELKRLEQVIGDRIAFVFRHFPLTTVHAHAELAAEAAEAAGAQGRFWEMHDTLFENQDDLEPESLLRYAEQLQLDVDRFRSELERGIHRPRVRRDFMRGIRSGVNGTPTFFINGTRYVGPPTADGLLAAMQGETVTGPGFPW